MKRLKKSFNGNLIGAVVALGIILLGSHFLKKDAPDTIDVSVLLLLECSGRGDPERIKNLIGDGAKVNIRGAKGWSPLHAAAYQGHREAAELLIARGADLEAFTEGPQAGSTPLHAAAFKGHRELVELLIERGARVNAVTRDGKTPLDYAEVMGHEEVVELLRRYGGTRP